MVTHWVRAEQLDYLRLRPPATGMKGWLLKVRDELTWPPLQAAAAAATMATTVLSGVLVSSTWV